VESSIENDLKPLNSIWWLMVLLGLISLGVGIFFVASPHETLSTFTIIAGIVLVIDGALAILASIFGKGDGRGLLAIVGVLGLIAGLILIKHPFSALVVFVMIIGIWLLAAGIVRFVLAFADHDGRGANLILATIDTVAGLAILVWPDLSLSTLAVIIGIVLIIRGLADIYAGFVIRGAVKDLQAGALAALTVLAMALVVAGCGSKPAYCENVTTLQASVKDLPTSATTGGVSGLKTQLTSIEGQVQTLVASAKADFPNESHTVEATVNQLSTSVNAISGKPTAAEIAALGINASAAVTAVQNFQTATASECK
jgi:uncharacterized membrane protein HdeD (DUF308 family)